jgi:tubulin beta
MLAGSEISAGRVLTSFCQFQGTLSMPSLLSSLLAQKSKGAYCDFIPDSFSAGLVPGSEPAGVMLTNRTSIQSLHRRGLEAFWKMYRRRAYVHRYLEEGMSEMEFEEAAANLQDLVSEYQQYDFLQPDRDPS